MNELIAELERLYFLDGQQWPSQQANDSGQVVDAAAGVLTRAVMAGSLAGESPVALSLVSSDAMVRTMVVDFARAGDWQLAARLFQAVQSDLNLPAPALSVSGHRGYAIWFSLAEPVPVAQARCFLDALRLNYLADSPAANVDLRPDTDSADAVAPAAMNLPPSLNPVSGKWSAFIDPSLGGMFIDEPWLEMAPNCDRQAAMLAELECIKAEDFRDALSHLQSLAAPDTEPEHPGTQDSANEPSATNDSPGPGACRARSTLKVDDHYGDPQSFLLAVMNDPSASARQRISAAKALLPFFGKKTNE